MSFAYSRNQIAHASTATKLYVVLATQQYTKHHTTLPAGAVTAETSCLRCHPDQHNRIQRPLTQNAVLVPVRHVICVQQEPDCVRLHSHHADSAEVAQDEHCTEVTHVTRVGPHMWACLAVPADNVMQICVWAECTHQNRHNAWHGVLSTYMHFTRVGPHLGGGLPCRACIVRSSRYFDMHLHACGCASHHQTRQPAQRLQV
jgi:hypothetical protein